MAKSYKMEVLVEGKYSSNNMAYATQPEAEEAGRELLNRWFEPTAIRAVESEQPVNARFNFEAYKAELL